MVVWYRYNTLASHALHLQLLEHNLLQQSSLLRRDILLLLLLLLFLLFLVVLWHVEFWLTKSMRAIVTRPKVPELYRSIYRL